MGQTPQQGVKVSLKPIAPLPGTYGALTRKRNHVTVYSPKLHLFCYVKIAPEWTVQDLKHQLILKFSHQQCFSLFLGDTLLLDAALLASLQVTEGSLLRLEFLEDSVEGEDWSKDESGPVCGLKDSVAMGSTTPDSAQSLPCKQPWEIDFSVYALPEAGALSTPPRRKSKAKTF
jgi:hypothetical protein